MSVELLDDLEAGELSVQFEGEEPEVLLEWAIERFSPGISISTAFQTDGAVLLHMAYAVDPNIRMFSVDTGRLPGETYDLIEEMRDRYPGLRLELLSPSARSVSAMVNKHGPNLFYKSVENRLLCCQVRKVLPLQQHLAILHALRREGVASERAACGGKSYGGYLAAWAAGHCDEFESIVVSAPVADVEAHFGTSDSG